MTREQTDRPQTGLTRLEPPPAPKPGPAWIVLPARAVAVVIVLPSRLVYDLLKATAKGLGRLPRRIGRTLRAVYLAVLHPVLRPIGNALAWTFSTLVVPVIHVLIVIPAIALWHALTWTAGFIGTVLALVLVVPARALWRYVLRPPLLGLAWLARGVGTGIAAAWTVVAGALAWSWHVLGRLGRVLFVVPAVAVHRYTLRPTGRAIAWTWRLTVLTPSRAVKNAIILPIASWTRRTITAPIGRTMRQLRLSLRR